MKIKQLIKKLQKLDQNMEVYSSDTEVIIYVQRNVGNVEVVVCGRVQSLPGVGDKLIFSVADINGKGIELTLDEYETAADALYAHICEAIMNNPTNACIRRDVRKLLR